MDHQIQVQEEVGAQKAGNQPPVRDGEGPGPGLDTNSTRLRGAVPYVQVTARSMPGSPRLSSGQTGSYLKDCDDRR